VAYWGHASVKPVPSSGRAEPAPPRGWTIRARKALRGKPGDNVEGGFLGGSRSPRPHATAGRMARHCVATGAFPRSRWPRTSNVGVNVMPSSGRAEPAPPRGGLSKLRRPCGGRPGDDAKGGFLGGARSPRPHGTAGRMARHCVATDAFTRSRWPRRGNVGVSVMPSLRACGARPSTRWAIQAKRALRGKPGDNAEGGSLGDTVLGCQASLV